MNELEILLQNLEKLHPKYIDLSLYRINRLLKKLGNPHLNIPTTIHIAGTNGKGSTLSFIKNILNKQGYSVHAYISPHLKKINERFIITNKIITNKKLLKTLKYVEKINKNQSITFFEITTAAAFYLFNNNPADFVIIETGLGGKYDATNVIKKNLISVITPIGFDHKEYLGNSLIKITSEKLGIVKKESIVISSKQKDIVKKEIIKFTKKNNNKLILYGKDWKVSNINTKNFCLERNKKLSIFNNPKLLGEHQIYNASTAIIIINYLKEKGYKFSKKNINSGIRNMLWPGRLETVREKNPLIIIDGSHNVDGAGSLKKFLIKSNYKPWIIIGMLNTKDIFNYLKIIKDYIKGVAAVEIPDEKNSIPKERIAAYCLKLKILCLEQPSVEKALDKLINTYKSKQIIITGSLYLVGKLKKNIKLVN